MMPNDQNPLSELVHRVMSFVDEGSDDLTDSVESFLNVAGLQDNAIGNDLRNALDLVAARRKGRGFNGIEVSGDVSRAMARTAAAAAFTVAAQALAAKEYAAAKREAEARIASFKTDASAHLAELQRAVSGGDVLEATRLRGELEIGDPGCIAQAELELLRLHRDQGESAVRFARANDEIYRTLRDAAASRRDELARELELAQRQADTAALWAQVTGLSLKGAQQAAASSTNALDAAGASQLHQEQQRVRRFAGLPDSEPTIKTRPEAAAAQVDMSPSVTPTAAVFAL